MAAASPARELTQNPLQKTWEPYDNGLPAGHSAQRGGERGAGGGVSAPAALSQPWRAAAVSGGGSAPAAQSQRAAAPPPPRLGRSW